MMFIGIDPGLSGGIAALESNGTATFVWKMPETERDVFEALTILALGRPCHAVLEQVHAMPKQGVSSSFTFGKGYGALLMGLTAVGIPFTLVTPQKWQAALQCRSGGDKSVTKRRAQQLFPQVKVTHHVADSLLIAEFCRRTHLERLRV